jgi:cell division protein FtsB
MLNQKSMPVWVLADALIVILSLSFVLGLTIVAVAIPMIRSVHLEKSVVAMRSLRGEFQAKSKALAKLEASQQIDKRLIVDLETSKATLDADNRQLRRSAASEGAYRKELLNLKGNFARTVFLIDTSGSMQEPIDVSKIDASWGERPAPWPIVLERMDAWMRHLPIESFQIVCFNTELTAFPSSKTDWLKGNDAREKASVFLRNQKPEGYTCTEKAIERALESKPTAIILFTDGMPSDSEGNGDPAQQSRILVRVSSSKVPVHVVALSNYFVPRQGIFLQMLAQRSGGAFIGF